MLKFSTFAVLFTGAVLANAGFVPTYSVKPIASLNGMRQVVNDNNNHDVAVGVALGSTYNRAVLIKNNVATDLSPAAVAGSADAISDKGQAVGESYDGTKWTAFSYLNGVLTAVNPAAGALESTAQSVNGNGLVSGYFSPAGVDKNSADHIYIRQANGTYSDLGNFGIDPYAASINNHGRVLIGTTDADGIHQHAFISLPGSTSLETVTGLVPGASVYPGGMNTVGLVVATAYLDSINQKSHAIIYFQGHTKDLGVLTGDDSTWGAGINNMNQTVGTSYRLSRPIKDATGKVIGYTPEVARGWVTVGGVMYDLNTMLGPVKGWNISSANGINDKGEVIADASFNGGTSVPVVLAPNAVMP